jgi:hypothetical protein
MKKAATILCMLIGLTAFCAPDSLSVKSNGTDALSQVSIERKIKDKEARIEKLKEQQSGLQTLVDDLKKASADISQQSADSLDRMWSRALTQTWDTPKDFAAYCYEIIGAFNRLQQPLQHISEFAYNSRDWIVISENAKEPANALDNSVSPQLSILSDIIYQGTNPSAARLKEVAVKLQKTYSNESYNRVKKEMLNALDAGIKKLEGQLAGFTAELEQYETELSKYYNELQDRQVNINQIAIRWGLPFFCGTIIVLFLATFYFNRRMKNGDAVENKETARILVEVITVLLLTMTVLILGLSGKLEGSVLGTLLGGIAGYVLNRTASKKQD